ncbi:MAG: DUF6922 domain-containing protein [Bacteroidia bacterium]
MNQIILGKRDLPLATALKLEKALGLEEGILVLLQSYYEIEWIKKKQAASNRPDLSRLRKSFFWDTDIKKIDWDRHTPGVIKRV